MAPPPGSRALRPALAPGDLLAERYRLVEPIAPATPDDAGPAALWLARDEVLARPVAAKVLPAAGRRGAAAARPFLEAAAAAGALASPVLARVYDAALEQRPAERAGRPAGEIDVAYVISEWVDGPSLVDVLLADGPYDPADAVALVTAVAEALTTAHARGVVHGRLHPGNLLFTAGGTLKLTDLAVSAALPERAVPSARSTDPDPAGADVRDLAAVLYALLTARWPRVSTPQPAGGLAPAPEIRTGNDKRGRLTSPRQVRAGVPRALDAVVVRALDPTRARLPPRVDTPARLSDAAEDAVRDSAPALAAAVPSAPRVPPWLRRRLPVLGVAVLLTAIGLTAYSVGRNVGGLPGPVDDVGSSTTATASAAPAGARLDLTTLPVRDFDPEGDGRERPGSVPNAHDDDLTTTWATERYGSPAFGGLKRGVGLLVDLGAPTAVTRVELVRPTKGTVVELRAADAVAPQADGFRVVAQGRAEGDRLALAPAGGTRARYWLVWFTGLAPDGDQFSAGLAELLFTRGAR